MSTENLEALLAKYKDGNCSDEELAMIEDLLFPGNEGNTLPEIDEAALNDQIRIVKGRIDDEVRKETIRTGKKTVKFRRIINTFSGVAASIALVLTVSALLYSRWDSVYNSVVPLQTRSYSTTTGKQLKIQLPDGSEVWLNSSSSLSLNNRYDQQTREVTLSGEAFFKVKKDTRSFIVHSGDLNTKVLGTSFNVRAYKSGKSIDVALLSGKVWISHKGQNAILKPNQLISLDKTNGKLGAIQSQPVGDQISWKGGKLIFKNTSVTQVFQRLQGIYDLNFDIRDQELTALTIYGTFNMNDQPKAIVEAICKLVDAKFKFISPKHVIIYQASN